MAVKKKAKVKVFASKSELRRHEKMETPKMAAAEKKMGEKDMVKNMKTMKKGMK